MDKKNLQVVVFVTSWCPHCKNMKNNVWTNGDVLKRVEPYFEGKPAIVSVDQPGMEYLWQQFQIEAFPTVVIMDEDRKVHKRAKNMTAEQTIEFLENIDG